MNETARKLSEGGNKALHTIVAKLMFLCMGARTDILNGVAFLKTRVRDPGKYDNEKMGCIMKYLNGTRELVLTLESNRTVTVKRWADVAFAVPHDMKSHTGGMVYMGRGALYSAPIKHKLNTKISTEAELVEVDDLMPQILWMQYFLEAQGMKVFDNVVYQDNHRAMKLEKYGRASSGKQTRHISIRYFIVTECIQENKMKVEYCPKETMIDNFYIKPLQGKLPRLFRNLILNLREDDISNITN